MRTKGAKNHAYKKDKLIHSIHVRLNDIEWAYSDYSRCNNDHPTCQLVGKDCDVLKDISLIERIVGKNLREIK